LHQQWSLNKTAPRECVVDSKKLVSEKKIPRPWLQYQGCSMFS
jgi:hypothetical protein